MHDVDILLTRRTHVMRHAPERLAQILRDYSDRGRLATRPDAIARQPHGDGTWTVQFDVWEDPPPPTLRGHLRRAWARRPLRRTVLVLSIVCALFLTGQLVWAFLGDEITAGVVLLLKAGAVALLLVGTGLIVRNLGGGGCPGASNHCPPGFHR